MKNLSLNLNRNILFGAGAIVVLAVGMFIGDKYGLPFRGMGLESDTAVVKCLHGTKFAGRYIYVNNDGSSDVYIGCRASDGNVYLHLDYTIQ